MVASLLGARRPELKRMTAIPKTEATRLDSFCRDIEEDTVERLVGLDSLGNLQMRRIGGDGFGTTEGSEGKQGWASIRNFGEEGSGQDVVEQVATVTAS